MFSEVTITSNGSGNEIPSYYGNVYLISVVVHPLFNAITAIGYMTIVLTSYRKVLR
jgi:hypothetical protein